MHALSLSLLLAGVVSAGHKAKLSHGVERYARGPARLSTRDDLVHNVVPVSNGSSSLGAQAVPGISVTYPPQSGSSSPPPSSGGSGSGSKPKPKSGGNSTAPSGGGSSGSSGSGSSNHTGACFPMGGATLPSSGVPSMSREDWWCDASQQTGFLGFSHALEATDCNDPTNRKDTLVKTFADMKKNYGASMIRIYAPQCRSASLWSDLLDAAATNNMGLIPMDWWGFGNQNLWKESASQLLALFEKDPRAKYVIHSVAFGSEPIGDGVDGGPTNFVKDLAAFRKKANAAEIPVAISEDWDRPGIMTKGTLDTLASVGESIKENTDLVQAHIMPYYHVDEVKTAFDAWPYFEKYIKFLNSQVKKQILITETPWADTSSTSHGRGEGGIGEDMSNFKYYWTTVLGSAKSCQFFKQQGVGWFMHTYSNEFEDGFGLLSDSNKPVIDFKPATC